MLTGVPSHVAKQAETELKGLNVEIIYDTKVLSSTEEAGKTILELSTGSKLTTALYLPTIGTIPNTEFIPKEFLNATTNEVSVDEYLRVKNLPDAWAAGDVTDIEPSQYVYGDKQAATLAKNLDLMLTGKQPVVYTPASTPVMGVTIGRSKATGRMGNTKLPSIVIWFASKFLRDSSSSREHANVVFRGSYSWCSEVARLGLGCLDGLSVWMKDA